MSGRRDPALKPHATDVLSLVFGLLFLGAAACWLLATIVSSGTAMRWVVACTLIVIGAIGLLAAARPRMRARQRHDESDGRPHDTG